MLTTVRLLRISTQRSGCVKLLHVSSRPLNLPNSPSLTSLRRQKWAGMPILSARFSSVHSPSVSGSSVDTLSSSTDAGSPVDLSSSLGPIPEPPVPLEAVTPILEAVGEPSFESLGLGGWGPIGIVENCFQFLHITCDMPWWAAIVAGTVVVRTLMFPLVIAAQRNAAKMNNNLPQMQVLQMKMSDARERGDRLDAARYAQEMMVFMKEKGLNPLKNMMVPLAQAPIFLSFFWGLREMANLPVGSLREGGLFWFVDLTVPDEFYLLPLITSATLYLTIELGTDAARLNSANLGMMKYVFRALPIVIFPFTLNFPAAILVYWVSTNFISLCQVSLLRIPRVREFFNIEKLINHSKENLPIKEKGFVKGVSESWTNLKLSQELEERHRIDEISFSRAGRGPIKKTYKYDPTRPPRNISVQAKKRE